MDLALLKDRADKLNFHTGYLFLDFLSLKVRWAFSF